jgi:outer membrane protein OmpA-like peptidoglycan-associated protein
MEIRRFTLRNMSASVGVVTSILAFSISPSVVADARSDAKAEVTKGMALSDGSPAEEQHYLDASAMDPSYPEPYFNLGLVHCDRKEYESAIAYFVQYLQFDMPGSRTLKGRYMLGLSYDHLGRIEKALEAYDKYLAEVRMLPHNVDTEEAKYEERAKQARDRLRGGSGRRGDAARALIKKANSASVDEIVEMLIRPRARTVWRYMGPVVPNSKILFDQGKAELLPESFPHLDKFGKALEDSQVNKSNIEISGHASSEGGKVINQPLSERRAAAVKQYLVTHFNIDASLISVKGYGATILAVKPEKTPEDYSFNRRVEFENRGTPSKPPEIDLEQPL